MMERPNLKICIENDADSESDEEKPIISEFLDDEESEDGEITSSRGSESSKTRELDGGGDNDQMWGVENDRPAVLEVEVEPKKYEPKRYENRGGEFQTGFDLLLKEYIEIREKRSERFGTKDARKTVNEEEMKALYNSLHLSEPDLECGEKGIRLETLHLRGVEEMSTKDVFEYFQEFAPGSLEWIDDTSCNVVWLEPIDAARALIHKSRPIDATNDTVEKQTQKSQTESMSVDEESKKASTTAEKDDFDYDLSLMSDDDDDKADDDDDKADDKPTETSEKKIDDVEAENMETEETKTEESRKKNRITAPDKEPEDLSNIPPGYWRVGIPFKNKARILFMRYATNADKKVQGAEKRSKYYRKYGNPNYGGIKGLISGSKKKRIMSAKYRQEKQEAKLAVERTKQGHLSEDEEETSLDDLIKSSGMPKSRTRLELRANRDKSLSPAEEDEQTDDDEEHDKELEDELRMLLGDQPPPPKKRTMRMYADDIDDAMSKKSDTGGAFSRLDDARNKIRGRKKEEPASLDLRGRRKEEPASLDLRSRLGRKRVADSRSSEYPSLTIQVEPD